MTLTKFETVTPVLELYSYTTSTNVDGKISTHIVDTVETVTPSVYLTTYNAIETVDGKVFTTIVVETTTVTPSSE